MGLPDAQQPLTILVGKRPQEDAVHHGEDGGGCAHAEGKREDGEAEVSPEFCAVEHPGILRCCGVLASGRVRWGGEMHRSRYSSVVLRRHRDD